MSDRSDAEPAIYEIEVAGHLDESWAAWFDESATVRTRFDEGEAISIVTGAIVDQAALHRILAKIGDLGLQIRNVHRVVTPEND